MKQLILIRHTTTLTEPGFCHGGGSEIPLAATFEAEAEILGSQLPPQIDHFHTSPLRRCQDLAQRLQPHAAWQIDTRLAEIHFGEWENQLWTNLAGPQLDAWMADFVNIRAPGGESTREVAIRVQPFLDELEMGTHLAITHGGVIRIILATVLGLPMENLFQIEIPFGGVVKILWNHQRWILQEILRPLPTLLT